MQQSHLFVQVALLFYIWVWQKRNWWFYQEQVSVLRVD